MIHRGARHSESANSEMFSRSTDRTAGGDDPSSPSSARKSSPPVQKTGPINARLPNIAKTRESNPLENLRTAARCGGGGRGKPRRERGDESWTIENRIGGSFCRCRNRWRGFITPVANRNLRAMSFYRKEEARNVRGFCCPRPLLPPSPLFPSFLGGEGKRGEASFIPTRLFSSLLSAPSRAVQKLAFCRDYFARVKPRGKRGRERERVVGGYTHDALIGKVGWKRRGDTTEGTSGSVERARDGGKFDADAVGPCWKGFRKKGRVSPARSLRGGANKGNRCALRVLSPWTSKSLAWVFPSIWTVRSVVFARFFISLENFSSIDFGRKRFLLQYVRWFSCDIYQERVTIIFICEKKISRTYIFWFLFGW